jgi:hypothetical protein
LRRLRRRRRFWRITPFRLSRSVKLFLCRTRTTRSISVDCWKTPILNFKTVR